MAHRTLLLLPALLLPALACADSSGRIAAGYQYAGFDGGPRDGDANLVGAQLAFAEVQPSGVFGELELQGFVGEGDGELASANDRYAEAAYRFGRLGVADAGVYTGIGYRYQEAELGEEELQLAAAYSPFGVQWLGRLWGLETVARAEAQWLWQVNGEFGADDEYVDDPGWGAQAVVQVRFSSFGLPLGLDLRYRLLSTEAANGETLETQLFGLALSYYL